MLPLLIAALLGLSGILVVIYPLLGLEQVRADAAAEPVFEVADRERTAKRALRDVDFDYRLGNLDEEDYCALRQRYERRALAALKTRYEREQALDALIDEQLAALRDAKRPATGTAATAAATAKPATAPVASKAHAHGHARTAPRSIARRRKGV